MNQHKGSFGTLKKMVWVLGLALVAACGQTPSAMPEANDLDSSFVGLLKVDVSGADTANPTATAQFVDPRADGVQSQAVTVVPSLVVLNQQTITTFNDNSTNTRHLYITFGITNNSKTSFPNLTLFAVHRPSNIGGTALASLRSFTNTPITSEAVARRFQPTHTMSFNGTSLVPNTSQADLQLYTSAEAASVTAQGRASGLLTTSDTTLEYGYVARNLSGGRAILPRNALTCTVNSCKGIVNLSYKFPTISPPENNPASFQMFFLVAQETTSIISQSLEEQPTNTVAGLTNTSNFAQIRILAGSTVGNTITLYIPPDPVQDKTNNLCQVRTAVPTVANPSSVLMPSSVPSAPGSLDSCFGSSGLRATATAFPFFQPGVQQDLILQSDGKIVSVGARRTILSASGGTSDDHDIAVLRFNPNGSLDTSFGNQGSAFTNLGSTFDSASSVAIQTDGKIVVAGKTLQNNQSVMALLRYNPNGTLDTSFDGDGKLTTPIGTSNAEVFDVAIQPNGRIVVVGTSSFQSNTDIVLARYLSSGALDTSFGSGGKVVSSFGASDHARAVVLLADGKLVVAGGTDLKLTLLRYNPNGSLDTSFGVSGRAIANIESSEAQSLLLQPDGKLVAGGRGYFGDFNNFAVVVRFNPNGSLDPSFVSSGTATLDWIGHTGFYPAARSLALQADGKIVVGLELASYYSGFKLTRLNADGSRDISFDGDGVVDISLTFSEAKSLAVQPNGKILVGGSVANVMTLARLNP